MRLLALCSALFVVGVSALALAQDHRTPVTGASVTFHDIAAGDQGGITYRRGRSATQAIFDALKTKDRSRSSTALLARQGARRAGRRPLRLRRDEDLDVYVTNGPAGRTASTRTSSGKRANSTS